MYWLLLLNALSVLQWVNLLELYLKDWLGRLTGGSTNPHCWHRTPYLFVDLSQKGWFFKHLHSRTFPLRQVRWLAVSKRKIKKRFLKINQLEINFFFLAVSQPAGNQPVKPRVEPGTATLQPKTTTSRTLSTILPSSGGSTTPTPIRPASSVSTQTSGATTNPNLQADNPRPAV